MIIPDSINSPHPEQLPLGDTRAAPSGHPALNVEPIEPIFLLASSLLQEYLSPRTKHVGRHASESGPYEGLHVRYPLRRSPM